MFFNLFLKNSFPKLETFYLNTKKAEELEAFSWVALAVNQRSFFGSLLTKELALTPKVRALRPTSSLVLAETPNGVGQRVFLGPKKIFDGLITHQREKQNARVLFNDLIDAFIQKEIRFFTESMNQSTQSPRQLEAEEKSLEWMRVSFEMLTKGILESLTNPDYLFQTTLFLGENPKEKPSNVLREIRLITFNLDMTFLLLEDHNLRVLIYNKKPGDSTESLKPALVGDFSYRKREMFDHFIHLLSAVSKGLHA